MAVKYFCLFECNNLMKCWTKLKFWVYIKNINVKVWKIRSRNPNWGFSEGREKISEGRNDRQREVMV